MGLAKRPLGRSGLEITTWGSAPGPRGAGAGPSAGGRRTTRFRRRDPPRGALGINWIDTAAVYGLGPLRGGRGPGAA